MEKKDLVHIVKVSDDTFAQSEIIPNVGIMLCVLGLISSIQNYCELCGEKLPCTYVPDIKPFFLSQPLFTQATFTKETASGRCCKNCVIAGCKGGYNYLQKYGLILKLTEK